MYCLGARRVYFDGETGYHPDFRLIGEKLGPFDALLLPIGAYEPRWFRRTMHMNPEEAVRAAIAIHEGAADQAVEEFALPPFPAVVPIHRGTFKLTDEPMDEPPRRARQAWELADLPEERLWLLAPGETRGDFATGFSGHVAGQGPPSPRRLFTGSLSAGPTRALTFAIRFLGAVHDGGWHRGDVR